MNSRPLLLVLGGLLLALAIAYDLRAVAWMRFQQREARAAADDAQRLQTELTRLSERGLAQASAPDVLMSQGGTGNGNRPSPPKDASTRPLPKARLLLGSDPRLSARYVADYANLIDARFGLEFRRLGLSPENQSQLRSILTDIEAQRLKLAQLAADQGVDPDDPSLRETKDQLMQADNTALKQLLTPDQVTEVRGFSEEGSIVDTLQEFAGNALVSTVSTDQTAALLPILEATSQRDADGDFVSHSVNIPNALAAAAAVLSPDQLAVFSAILKKDEASHAIDRAGGN